MTNAGALSHVYHFGPDGIFLTTIARSTTKFGTDSPVLHRMNECITLV